MVTRHDHDIEAPCTASCPANDPAAWRCSCGSNVMLADTEGWKRPRCFDCWVAIGAPLTEPGEA